MQAHAMRTYPDECVGALVGQGDVVSSVVALDNAAHDCRRLFMLSARDQLRVERESSAAGHDVLGFYHSHPDGPALLSATDRAHAFGYRWAVIISVTGNHAGEPQAFQLPSAWP
jgi:proteasome lid subunit RPN8/RPN11